MKIKDIAAGEVYWHASTSDWLIHDNYDSYAVRITDTSQRYGKSYGFAGGHYPDEQGKYLRGEIVEAPGGDAFGNRAPGKVVYVLPQGLRGPVGPVREQMAEARQRRADERAARAKRHDDADARAAETRRRLAQHFPDVPDWSFPVRVTGQLITVELDVGVIERVLDALDQATPNRPDPTGK